MNYIVSSIFTTCIDPQNGGKWAPTYGLLQNWVESALQLKTISTNIEVAILYDRLGSDLENRLADQGVTLITVPDCNQMSPYDYRWIVYNDFLEQNKDIVQAVFFTDISDVLVKSNPFSSIVEGKLYTGDEETFLSMNWIDARSHYYIENLEGFKEVYSKHSKDVLLNCGIVGGYTDVVLRYLVEMSALSVNTQSKPYWTTDMVAHNYVIRKYFAEAVHGEPVNSRFKRYETHRSDVWFVHK